ncbi:matrix metalloproteinase-17-like isoform X1 [Macrobrachium nipponense]|uniref:matrix metalloproteinase-17-like isoform X1 n=2 Tax=Macrobrachium nipponense TaxID=159736 RepID=UPI0030C85162
MGSSTQFGGKEARWPRRTEMANGRDGDGAARPTRPLLPLLKISVGLLLMVACTGAMPVSGPLPRLPGDVAYSPNRLEDAVPTPVVIPTPPPGLNFTTEAPRVGSTLHAAKFMEKFGYIPKSGNESDFVFSADAFQKAVMRMQKFGSIPQTGVIDNATIELMQTPRCGLPDVEPEDLEGNSHIRKKRYILGSGGWRKRKLTYFVANWSPKLWNMENVKRELRRAFDAWSTYSHLQFTEVAGPEADIVIYFASYDHHDGYPFDGPSGILAHAYYPYEFGHYGGDVHFDESEEWTIDPKDEYSGLDFFTVAVHEIGHSLGLAHSPVAGSIMFPYYKGYDKVFSLDYDDVMAMWELYIKRKLEGDDEYFKSTTTTTPSTPTTNGDNGGAGADDEEHQSDAAGDDDDDDAGGEGDGVHQGGKGRGGGGGGGGGDDHLDDDDDVDDEEEEKKRREEERRKDREEEEERRRWEEEIRRREAETRRREEEARRRWEEEEGRGGPPAAPTTEKPPPPIPDLCQGSYDAAALLRQELFVFKGEYLWRFRDRGELRQGYPSLIRNLFTDLPSFLKRIDAVYQRQTDSNFVFFIGKYYYVHNGDHLIEGSPRPLSDLGIPDLYTKIDAAFYWPRAKRTYFFSRNWYFRYDDVTGKMDEGYPRDMKKWNGIPGDLDDVFTWNDGESYFLKGTQFWKYDSTNIRPYAGYPQDAREYWINCPATS